MKKLLLATGNAGKLKEVRALLAGTGVEVIGLAEIPHKLEVVEDGETFLENARIKAVAYHRATGLPVLADDSGLAVDALGGKPGVRSARYAGEGASDEENWRKLLSELKDVPEGKRGAAFVCALVLILENGRELSSEGRCEGRIILAPRGEEGFGYDPVFEFPEVEKTLAEVDMAYKNRVSHRARALSALKPGLLEALGSA